MNIATAVTEAFMFRFTGLSRAYGTYDLRQADIRGNDGKRSGKAITKRAEVTIELYANHLAGIQPGLGIVPIRDGNDCTFGAIDIDVYENLSHAAIVARLKRDNIPLVVCRTKSGGAHLYCFAKAPVPAALMQSRLREIASYLGYGDCEVFPKQSQLLTAEGDVGGWINIPYFDASKTMRYAVAANGDAMSIEQFLDYSKACEVPESWFTEKLVTTKDFEDGPPCLQALVQIGYPNGTRNDGLYNIGVYLKRSHPDTWENDIEDFNHKYMDPPLTIQEVQGTIKSLRKKEYMYGCTKQPIMQHCNAVLCRTRKFGVGSGASGRFPMLGGLSKLTTNPPIWFWTVEGVRMELSTGDLQDPRAFQLRFMECLNMVVQVPARPVWEAAVQHAMSSITIIEAPTDSSPEGLFWDMVEKFCTGRAQALSIDEIALGKPYSEVGRTYFRMPDLISYLNMHKFFDFKSQKIASMLRDAKAEHHFKMLKGRGVNFWSIAEFARQNESFEVPADVKDAGEVF
jgi:hypothetical protein